jgi:hypothetical protein
MNNLNEDEKKALLQIFDIAVKTVGLSDGGVIIGNCQHFIKLINQEEPKPK